MGILTINWLVVEPYPSEKYDFVSWDDDIPNLLQYGKIKTVPNHQPDSVDQDLSF
jgi:hypothetical protein